MQAEQQPHIQRTVPLYFHFFPEKKAKNHFVVLVSALITETLKDQQSILINYNLPQHFTIKQSSER